MTEKLRLSIENLYSIFSIYPLHEKIEGCPCCVSDSMQSTIQSKELRKLSNDDLSKYAFKAITTWGNTSDFKHFLPRIFELMSSDSLIVNSFTVLRKLSLANWKEWSEKEQQAINIFLFSWWENILRYKDYFDHEIFVEIYKLTQDIDQLINHWIIKFDENSFISFINLIEDYFYDLKNDRKEFKEFTNIDTEKFIKWIDENAIKLEDGFFYFESKDSKLQKRISNSLYIYEHIYKTFT